MTKNGVGARLAGCLLFIASALVYLTMQSRGFPDGHLTELDRAENVLATLFIGVSTPAGVWFIVLGGEPGKQLITKRFRLTLLLYALFTFLLLGIDLYLRHHLDNGAGG